MVLPTAERTTQVQTTGVAGVREKANPAVRTVGDAAVKLGMELQHRVQRGLILPDERLGTIVLMPIRVNREKLLDGYGKKARLSFIIWIVLCTPSSYFIDAKASRGRPRFFLRYERESASNVNTNDSFPNARPGRSACRVNADSRRTVF